MRFFKNRWVAVVLAVSLSGLAGCDTPLMVTASFQYSNPSWAPPYNPGVRYYYLPDIETYYDMTDHNFVYLDNGNWLFSPTLPSLYGSYDLYNGFVIALNLNVYQPWMHHQYYVSNYPRYYYRNVYRNIDIRTVRGFNENERKPIYWRQEDHDRINDLRRNDRPQIIQPIIRPPQNTNYYGRNIGQPVKVRPYMKERKEESKGENRHENRGDNRRGVHQN